MTRIPQQISKNGVSFLRWRHRGATGHGFALIVVLSLMGFLLLLLLGLVAVLHVELAVSSTQRAQEEARQNALYGLDVALGNMQKMLGKDQRITASGRFINPTGMSDTSPLNNWTGVWDTVEKNSDHTPKIWGMLTSGYESLTQAQISALESQVSPVKADGTPASDNEVIMVGAGSVDSPSEPDTLNVTDYVAAQKVDIDDKGQYAYWVADEGRKTRINLASRTDLAEAAYAGTNATIQSRLNLSSPGGSGGAALTGLETLQMESDSDLARSVSNSASPRELMISEPGSSGNWQKSLPGYFHDTTYYSTALQTDTRNGGLKKDLSLLFELSDSDFAKTPYSGTATDATFNDWPDSVLPPTDKDYTDPASKDQVSYLFKEYVPEYASLGDLYIRGPTWAYLRDFYRLYKNTENNGTNPTIPTQPFSPTAQDLNSLFPGEGSKHGYIATMETDNGGERGSGQARDGFVNYNVTVNSKSEKMTQLTAHPVMPVLNRTIYAVSLYNDENVDEWKLLKPGDKDSKGNTLGAGQYKFEPTGAKTDAVALLVQPFVYLWNPYNVAIEFNGGMKVDMGSLPFLISVAPAGTDYFVTDGDPADFETPQMSGVTSTWGRINSSNMDGITALIGGSGQTIRMEPGEVLLFSAPGNPKPLSDLPANKVFQLSQGFNDQGGLLIGRRTNSKETFPTEGVFYQLKTGTADTYDVNVHPWGGSYNNPKHDFRKVKDIDDSTNVYYVPSKYLASGGDAKIVDTQLQRIWIKLIEPSTGLGISAWLSDDFPKPVSMAALAVQGRIPLFFYGFYQNTVTPDTTRLLATSEFNGTMSPFGQADPQFSNTLVNAPPYSIQTGPLPPTGLDEIAHSNDKGFFGRGYSDTYGNTTNLVISELPTYPMQSLASFQHARISKTVFQPGQPIGNSWASGMVAREKTYDSSKGSGRYTQYDVSYLANDALFDAYYFSSLTPEMDLSGNVTQTADIKATLEDMVTQAAASGEGPKLRNERMVYLSDSESLGNASHSEFVDDLAAIDGFAKTAQYFGVTGGFNVNSLSVDAWDALLASTMGTDYSYLKPSGSMSVASNSDLTVLPRASLPNAEPGDEWLGPKGLTTDQRRALAEQIVEQVKLRGPFLNLADFVNRKLIPSTSDPDNLGKAGAIQAAMDYLDDPKIKSPVTINKDFLYDPAYKKIAPAFYEENVTQQTGVGTPQYLTQADVLTPLAPLLSARSDTFVIRSYGSVRNPFNPNDVSEAWCEAVVQRVPSFVDPADAPSTPLASLSDTNKDFGRQFKVLSLRWLSKDDV